MRCEEIFQKIGDYLDKDLDPHICEEIEDHIKDCEPCVAFINTLKKTVELFQVAKEDETIPEPVSSNLLRFLKKNIETESE
ncbi:MAG: anti-sigma factor family protein [Candidatus Nitrospinota bacterium M3_3B_026]